jgi:fatty acid desaturase
LPFAVTVQHDCDGAGLFARTLRGILKNAATYNMVFHVEHHLFPAVPACHLPQLADGWTALRQIACLRVF